MIKRIKKNFYEDGSRLLLIGSFLVLGLFPSCEILYAYDQVYPGMDKAMTGQQSMLHIEANDPAIPIYSGFPNNNDGSIFNTPQSNLNALVQLRLDGIGDDDNALGEDPVPVADGLFILLSLFAVFILYKHKKRILNFRINI